MRTPRHALLLSGDVKYLEGLEQAFKEAWPACGFSRVHPGGDLSAVKFQDAADLLIIQDLRQRYSPVLSRLIEERAAQGARLLLVSAIPIDLRLHARKSWIAHDLRWDSPKVGEAVVAAFNQCGFANLESRVLASRAGRMKVASATDKTTLTEELDQALERDGVQRTRRGKILTLADELLMNALYHGPSGGPKVKMPVNPETPLPGDAMVEVSWSIAKETFHLSVRDPFGTLGSELLQKRLGDFDRSESVEITRTGGRGGGVGLYTILRNSNAFHAFVLQGRLTEISVRVDLQTGALSKGEKKAREILLFFQ